MKLSGSATMSAPPRPASRMSSHAFAVPAARSSQTLESWTAAARNVAVLSGHCRSPRRSRRQGSGSASATAAGGGLRDRPGAEQVLAGVVAEGVPDQPGVVDERQVAVGHRDALLPVGHGGDGPSERVDDVAAAAVRPPRAVVAAVRLALGDLAGDRDERAGVERVRDAELAVLLQRPALRGERPRGRPGPQRAVDLLAEAPERAAVERLVVLEADADADVRRRACRTCGCPRGRRG